MNNISNFSLILNSYKKFLKSLKSLDQLFIFLIIIGGIVGSILELTVIVLVTPLISSLTGEEISNNIIKWILELFQNFSKYLNIPELKTSIILLIFVLVKNAYWIVYTKIIYTFSYNFELTLSHKIFKKFITLNYLDYVNKKTSDFIADATLEARKINLNFIIPSFIITTEIFVLSIIIVFLVIISSVYSIYSVLLIGLFMYIFHKIAGKKIKNYGEKRLEYENKRIDFIKHAFDSFKDIKLRSIESEYLQYFKYLSKTVAYSESKFSIIQQIPKNIYEMILYTLIVIILYYSNVFFQDTSLILGLGILIVSLIRIVPSITKITSNYQSLVFSLPSIKRFDIILPSRSEIINELNINSGFNQLEIQNLSFNYPFDKKKILSNLNLKLKKGEFIGIHGESGSGKSTVLHIISGLIDSYQGDLLLNSVKTKKIKGLVSYCPQDVILFNGSLAQNISFSLNQKVDFNKIKDLINKVGLTSLVNDLPNGLDSIISENGTNISGGQKQRIGIARALYMDSKILLLDEFTSALDKNTEQKILSNLLELKKQKISIVMVSHKTNPLKICDKIYELNKGNLIKK